MPDETSYKHFKDENFLKEVGQKIQLILKQKNITHEAFFFDTGITPHRILSGKVNMTLSTFKKILDYLDVSPGDFFNS